MTKNILKEIIIILLLTLAIILVLALLLYDYVPMNKVIPEHVTYTATEEIRAALEEKKASDNEEVILSYEVTATDLSNYKKVNDYKAGRKNPFSSVNSGDGTNTPGDNSNNGGTTSNNSGNGSNNSNSSEINNNSNSNNTNYYPDKGIK